MLLEYSSNNGEYFLVDELLVYQEWKAGYEVEVQANRRLERKLEGCFDSTNKAVSWMVILSLIQDSHEYFSPFIFLSENVIRKGVVVPLNPVCVLLSRMFNVY